MPRTGGDASRHVRTLAALRGAGFAAALVLDAFAVWLIATSTSQRHLEIGVLIGLWGLLVGASSMFVSRPEFQIELQEMVRREMAAEMSLQITRLRADLAALVEAQRAALPIGSIEHGPESADSATGWAAARGRRPAMSESAPRDALFHRARPLRGDASPPS